MDSGNGTFERVEEKEVEKLEKVESFILSRIFKEFEEVIIKDCRFRVQNINQNGRMTLKLLKRF